MSHANDTLPNDCARRLTYEYIAHQINREDTLVNYRLTWALQLNGFLFAALALVGKDVAGPVKAFFEFAIPLIGLSVTIAGFIGILAAQRQLRYLTSLWSNNGYPEWPRPFGDARAFRLGTYSAYGPMVILSLAWFALLVFNVFNVFCRHPTSA